MTPKKQGQINILLMQCLGLEEYKINSYLNTCRRTFVKKLISFIMKTPVIDQEFSS